MRKWTYILVCEAELKWNAEAPRDDMRKALVRTCRSLGAFGRCFTSLGESARVVREVTRVVRLLVPVGFLSGPLAHADLADGDCELQNGVGLFFRGRFLFGERKAALFLLGRELARENLGLNRELDQADGLVELTVREVSHRLVDELVEERRPLRLEQRVVLLVGLAPAAA